MPQASHRLDLYLVPTDPDRPWPDVDLLGALQARGWTDERGFALPGAEGLVPGGFVRARVDRPALPVLYGNQQGGFRARCPACGEGVAGVLAQALATWRAGKGRDVTCPSCGHRSALEQVDFQPMAAPARWAVVLADAEAAAPATGGFEWLEGRLGALRVILRRA